MPCGVGPRRPLPRLYLQTGIERADPSRYANDLFAYNSAKDSLDNASILDEYESGVRLSFSFASTGRRHERHFILTGQRGAIHATYAEGVITVESVGTEPETIVMPDEYRDEHGGGDTPLVDPFLRCVATGERPVADVIAGLHSVALGVAATQSIDRSGEAVDLRPVLGQFA